MKSVAKILLVLLFPILIFLCALSINLRGQFLSSGFWMNTFLEGNVYLKVSETIGDKLADKVLEAGGNKGDTEDLSGFISESSIRSFTEKNIEGILEYANGRDKELTLYAPILTGNSLSADTVKDLDSYSKEVSVSELLNEYNVSGVSEERLKDISRFGTFAWLILGGAYILLILDIFGLFLLTGEGKRFVSSAVGFVFSGLLCLGVYFFGDFISGLLNVRYIESTNLGTLFISIVAPPVIVKVIQIWMWFGVSSLVVGILLFFIKKPAKTKRK